MQDFGWCKTEAKFFSWLNSQMRNSFWKKHPVRLEMLKTKNFGKKSLDEIRRVLDEMSLDFGMKLDNFEKKYQEWKRKQQNEA